MNTGHGHVRPRPDGVKARCGGPALCPECAAEQKATGEAPADKQGAAPRPPVSSLPFEITFEMRPDKLCHSLTQRIDLRTRNRLSSAEKAHSMTDIDRANVDVLRFGFEQMVVRMMRELPAAERDQLFWFLGAMEQAAREARSAVSRAFYERQQAIHLNRFDGADDPLRDQFYNLEGEPPR